MAEDDIFPPDFSTELGQLRALIPDIEQVDFENVGDPAYLFTDAHLNAYLSMYRSALSTTARIKRAASDALTAIAVSEALISKVTKTEDLQTDGAKLANALLSAASRLRKDADEEEDKITDDLYGGIEIVDFQPYPMDSTPVAARGYPYGPDAWMTTAVGGPGFGRWL